MQEVRRTHFGYPPLELGKMNDVIGRIRTLVWATYRYIIANQ